MTAPLVPVEVNLRGLPWMRLDTTRLLDSDLFALSTGDEFKAAVALWCKSWMQTPGGSLPTDDRVLAHLSGAGAKWKRIKPMALRGWIECDDGRLYHPVVAEQALAAWEERQEFRAEVDSANERKKRERDRRSAMFDALRAAGHDLPWNTPTGKLTDLCRDLSLTPITPVTPKPVTGSVTGHSDSHGLDGTGRDGNKDQDQKQLSGERIDPPPAQQSARAPALVGTFEGHQAPKAAPPNPAAPFAIALNAAGFRCTSANPDLIAYAVAGGTLEHLAEIAAHPDCAGKAATYVLRFARRELTQPAAAIATGPPRNGSRYAEGPSKTLQGIQSLEEMKPDEHQHQPQQHPDQRRLASGDSPDRVAEAADALARSITRR